MSLFNGNKVMFKPFVYIIDINKDQVREQKIKAFKNPTKYLYPSLGKRFPQVRDIFNYLMSLRYEDEPNYRELKQKLSDMQS
jgi:hypothetical protein